MGTHRQTPLRPHLLALGMLALLLGGSPAVAGEPDRWAGASLPQATAPSPKADAYVPTWFHEVVRRYVDPIERAKAIGAQRSRANCVPTMTVEKNNCDGVDNDCDGLTDEDYDDGVACTLSKCVGGVATNTPQDAFCNDSEPCTADWCDKKLGCINFPDPSGKPNPSLDDDNPCTDLVCYNGKSVNLPDDGNIPTDGKQCTDDYCIGGQPYHDIVPGSCYIKGKCYLDGMVQKGGLCGVCRPNESQTSFSGNLYATTFDNGALDAGWNVVDHSASGLKWRITEKRAYSTAGALAFNSPTTHTYAAPKRVDTTAFSPAVKLPLNTPAVTRFRLWLQTQEYKHSATRDVLWIGAVEVNPDGTYDTDPAKATALYNTYDVIKGTSEGYWYNLTVDLTAFHGKDVRVFLRFDSYDTQSNQFEGAYVDNFEIRTLCCTKPEHCDDEDDCTTDFCALGKCEHLNECADDCQPNPSNILILQDTSASQEGAATIYASESIWQSTVDVIDQVTAYYENGANFALKTFKSAGAGGCEVVGDQLEVGWGASRDDLAAYLSNLKPTGNTPITDGLYGALEVFESSPYTDSKFVILISDGGSCGGDPVKAVEDLFDAGIQTFVVGIGKSVDVATFNKMAIAGGRAKEPQGPGDTYYYHVESKFQLEDYLHESFGLAVGERCNSIDDDCNGEIDDDVVPITCEMECGGTQVIGHMYCNAAGELEPCQLPPEVEYCNGKDDNCNGVVDDPWVDAIGPVLGQPCTVGEGACAVTGVWTCPTDGVSEAVCSAVPTAGSVEVCDNIDNDCDGFTDEDLTKDCPSTCGGNDTATCVAGQWIGCGTGGVGQADDQCDGVDNDCDGITDPLFPQVGAKCDGADADLCANGTWTCKADGSGVECVNEAPANLSEVCGGGDENCNGVTDEEGAVGCTTYYYDADGDGYGVTGTGRCLCAPDGKWTAPVDGDCNDGNAAVNPGGGELCDGLDNDCDGATDESDTNPKAKLSKACYTGPAGTLGVGTCKAGVQQCTAGAWGACTGQVTPQPETCDGLDTDCDWLADDQEPGPTGTTKDHPCNSVTWCMFGSCMCVEDTKTSTWGCILD